MHVLPSLREDCLTFLHNLKIISTCSGEITSPLQGKIIKYFNKEA